MGFYINPENETKEAFLGREAKKIGRGLLPDHLSEMPNGQALVCLVDSGYFTAAGIIFSQREFEDWTDRSDSRPKQWFMIDKTKLPAVSDIKLEHFEVFEKSTV